MYAYVRLRRPCVAAGLIALVAAAILFSPRVRAQSADDDDGPPGATLSLRYDARGGVEATFTSEGEIADWTPVEAAVLAAIHCPSGSLEHPEPYSAQFLASLSAKRRAQVEGYNEREQRSELTGGCGDAMARHHLLATTDLSLAPLLAALRGTPDQELWLTIEYPDSQYSQHTPSIAELREDNHYERGLRISYEFAVAQADPAIVHLEFGMRRSDVVRSAAFSVGFLLLPVVIMLWMRYAAMRDAAIDPTAAWFSYFRVLTWCVNGVMLLWMFDGHFRQGLEGPAAWQLAGHGAGSVALSVAIFIIPPWAAYTICILTSYGVYVRVRGSAWTRGEFYANQLLQVAAQLLPLMLLVLGLAMISVSLRVTMALLVAAYFTRFYCLRLIVRIGNIHPEALTTGDLRDRIFELAKKAGTALTQIYVMPAGKSQMANAFASRGRRIIFTDYLLSRMNKREVIAVAAHEITHVRRHHVGWKMAAFGVLLLSPTLVRGAFSGLEALVRRHMDNLLFHAHSLGTAYLRWAAALRWLHRTQYFQELDLIAFSLALILFYLQSRYMERVADAGAVQLTGDPEAVITSLVKLSRLNLMPIQWGRVTGSLLTHPSTLRRVERAAKVGKLPPERLQQILQAYQNPQSPGTDASANEEAILEDSFTEARPAWKPVVSRSTFMGLRLKIYWCLIALHILPPAAVAWSVAHWQVQDKPLAYGLGAVACIALYTLAGLWMGSWGGGGMQRAFQARLAADGISLDEQSQFVSLTPHADARFYESGFNWDTGYLFLARRRLAFFGDQVRFALTPDQVQDVRVGGALPGWYPIPRVYLDWLDPASGALRTWTLSPRATSPFWKWRRQAADLYTLLVRWRTNPSGYPEAPPLVEAFTVPAVGEVTGHPVRMYFKFGRFVTAYLRPVLFAVAFCVALHIPAFWYVASVILALRVWESIPFWRYKAPQPAAQPVMAAAE